MFKVYSFVSLFVFAMLCWDTADHGCYVTALWLSYAASKEQFQKSVAQSKWSETCQMNHLLNASVREMFNYQPLISIDVKSQRSSKDNWFHMIICIYYADKRKFQAELKKIN